MRILSWKELAKKQPYSRVHWTRLEEAGKVPKRIELSQNRVGWLESEVDEWIGRMIAKRDANDHS